MKRTDQVVTRDKERTCRAILESAEQMFADRGSKASLADIAVAAGVTKSGLMHHFPNRDALIYGVIEHCITRMWEEIHAHIDLSENRPGKFTRGYVRALTGGSAYLMDTFNPGTLLATLGNPPGIEALYACDAEKLSAAFAADGLPWSRVLMIRFAAEGLALSAPSPYLTSDDLELARAELLALTEVD
ncbi:TetR/AcrR family transcriptional regulator [Rhodococcus artemisiae]|uniref:TetR/AcrR family transcriptional regulator n=1 Tax=Rhodococcus artemisiae TaxID=714159 RepID=A0ABU7LGG9_9NOCA|nr:TetR/AcrR family transcriptional regulator [Rhodococcus artemisiae]MEE2060337.1 TetR/AcrR family transcriptional regulator [Rhodococcus artemisiae]